MAPTPMKSGGITQMQSGGILGIPGDSLSQSFINPMQQVSDEELNKTQKVLDMLPRNEDGSIDKSEIAKAVASGLLNATTLALIAFPEPTTTAIGTGLRGLGTFLKSPFSSKAKDSLLRTFGRRQAKKDEGKLLPTGRQTIDDAPVPAGYFEGLGKQYLKESVKPTSTRLSALAALGIMNTPDESTETVVEELTPEQIEIKRLQDLLAKANELKDKSEPVKKGLGSDDFLTLAQLGGIVGGATNLGEAAMGIGNLAGQIQKTRRESGLEGAQRSLLEAQAAKYIADVANMDLDNALQQYSAIPKLVESGVLTPEEAKIREAALIQRINEFQGTATNTSQKSYSQFVS